MGPPVGLAQGQLFFHLHDRLVPQPHREDHSGLLQLAEHLIIFPEITVPHVSVTPLPLGPATPSVRSPCLR